MSRSETWRRSPRSIADFGRKLAAKMRESADRVTDPDDAVTVLVWRAKAEAIEMFSNSIDRPTTERAS